MKRLENVLWGLAFIAVGSILALNALDITDIDIFFDGWWTLFIIVSCLIGLFREREKTGNLIGLLIGVALLLCAQDILSYSMIWKLAFPVILIIIGLGLLFKKKIDKQVIKKIESLNQDRKGTQEHYAIFSGQETKYDNQEFKGASFTAVFGGAECDLRQAVINNDQLIQCTAIFGGVDIWVPSDVKVVVKSTSIFGGVSEKQRTITNETSKTIYINAVCIFGGVDVK